MFKRSFERSQPASQLARFGVDGAQPQVPAFARFGVIRVKGSCRSSDRDDFERSQPASQLARFGVNPTKGSRRSGDRDDFERSQPASQLARSGVNGAAFQHPLSRASVGMGVRFGVGGAKIRGRKGGQSTCVGSRTAQITFCLGSRRFRNRDESGDRNSHFRRRFCLDRPITELDWKVAPTSGAVFSTQRSTKARRVTNPSVSEFVR